VRTGLRFGGDDMAAFASNWRTVVAIDALMGTVVLIAGAVAVTVGQRWAWLLVVAGAVELFFVGGRATRWARLRRQASHDSPDVQS